MVDSDKYQKLIDALSELFQNLPAEMNNEGGDPESNKKKRKTITIISVGKSNSTDSMIPKASTEE
jgi:hypothetical protein